MQFRVEWISCDASGREQSYASHDMAHSDAEAMARTLRAGAVSNPVIVPADGR